MNAERVRLERALQFATRRADGVSEAVTRFLATVPAPPNVWKAEYLTEADGSLVPIPTTEPYHLPINATAVYLVPYENEPLVFRAYSETVREVTTGHQIFPSYGETDFITRVPVRVDVKTDEWIFARTSCMFIVTLDSPSDGRFPYRILKFDDPRKQLQWLTVPSQSDYQLVVKEDPAVTNFKWWQKGDFALVQQVYENAKRYLMIASAERKPLISMSEEPTPIEAPMHFLSWREHASTALILSWMRRTGRGYVGCGSDFCRMQIGGLAAYISSRGSGRNASEHYFIPAWPPAFLIRIVRRVGNYAAEIPSFVTHVSDDVYELPLWPNRPWLYHPQSTEMNAASDFLINLSNPGVMDTNGVIQGFMCDNPADFDQGMLPDHARQKLELVPNYYDYFETGARTFYL